jgi:diguanylate cyclase (GGDEF)-like protein/PAS domain S-box-containing protein
MTFDPVAEGVARHTSVLRSLRAALPTGRTLESESWRRRHRAILVLLWLHVIGIYIYGVLAGYGWVHPFFEAGLVGMFAVAAMVSGMSRDARASFATLALVMSSGIMVHLSGGLIEMHFHFFVMVAVVALYQSWMPFLLAIGFVLLHHGVIGVLDSSAVYNHAAALANPWKWAAIHALFIAGESAAALTTWKMNEKSLQAERMSRAALELAVEDLAEAQSITHIGSWDWDVQTGAVAWSDELYHIFGVEPETFTPTYEKYISMVTDEDRALMEEVVDAAFHGKEGFDHHTRIERPDGTIRLVHATGKTILDENGVVVRLLGTCQDVTEQRELEDKVRHQAFHDSLTGLPNRELFLDRLEHARARQSRGVSSLGVLFVDLDEFKPINDTNGHRAGDELLVEIGQKIGATLRPADTFARLGGDEFAVLIEEVKDIAEVTAVAERIVSTLASISFLGDMDVRMTASIGVVLEDPSGMRSADEILRDADIAMYAAKKKGRGRYEVFDAAMREELASRLNLKRELQAAIEDNQLFLEYQPIVRMAGHEIEGVEALVRWRHPERGVVPPMEFIPFAEDSGQIGDIGLWVLRRACRDTARWQAEFPTDPPLRLSVNVSAIRFMQAGFIDELKGVLSEAPLAPDSLVLEITESVLLDSVTVADRLAEVKRLGVQLAIDDFGTGYSSLGYLRTFPIDLLKIDKSFIDSVATGVEGSALARAVVKLGDSLGLRVVAEGVEALEQADVLAAMGCELAQGFLFSRPVAASSIDDLLAAREYASLESHVS